MGYLIDTTASAVLCIVLAFMMAAFYALTVRVGPRSFERLEREAPIAIVGKAPMEAVYSTLEPLARLLASLGVTANGVTLSSLVLAGLAAMCFASGHFGVGALVACVAALADAVDGLVARQTGTASQFGKLLDTLVDRYVEALLIGGIAIWVHDVAWMLALTFAALVGGFMVSYTSSMLREIGAPDLRAPMRRAERLSCLLAGAAFVPLVASIAPDSDPAVHLSPLLLALGAIAVIGNVSAVRRLLGGGRLPEVSEVPSSVGPSPSSSEKSWPTTPGFLIQRESRSVGGTDERRRSPRARCDADSV